MLPCTAAAVWCADRRPLGRRPGTAVAGAFLTKQTGRRGAAAGALAAWRAPRRRAGAGTGLRPWRAARAACSRAALVTDPAGFLFWTVTGSGSYAYAYRLRTPRTRPARLGQHRDPRGGLRRPPRARPYGPCGRARRSHRSVGVAGGVGRGRAVGFHFFGHYYLQLLPPVALLATAALRALPRAARATAVSPRPAPARCPTGAPLAPRSELDHAERVAAAVTPAPPPGDRSWCGACTRRATGSPTAPRPAAI